MSETCPWRGASGVKIEFVCVDSLEIETVDEEQEIMDRQLNEAEFEEEQ